MDFKKAIAYAKNVMRHEGHEWELCSVSQMGWLIHELENAANTMEAQNTSTNIPSMPFIKQCTCGKRIATVHLCEECFRDAVTG